MPEIPKYKSSEDIVKENLGPKFKERAEEFKKEVDEFKKLIGKIYENLDKYDKLCEFCIELRKKYGNEVLKYGAYHLAIGSTPDEKTLEKWDLEGEDSVVEFVKKLLESPKESTKE